MFLNDDTHQRRASILLGMLRINLAPGARRCSRCKIRKSTFFFRSHKYTCTSCRNADCVRRFNKNMQTDPSFRKAYYTGLRAKSLMRKYGLTVEGFYGLMAIQEGACAICQVTMTLASDGGRIAADSACVDHDHNTGRVRGILCSKCNLAIGKFADSPSRLRRAADYLERAGSRAAV